MEHLLDANLKQSEIVRLYDKISIMYDIWGHLAESHARRRAIELANIKNGEAILEVAVGTGLGFYEIVKRNPDGINTGMDISAGMLQKAQRRLRSLGKDKFELKLGNAFDLEIPDQTIDLLVNSYMFDLIPFAKMDDILREFKRVLKPNGRLILANMTQPETGCASIYHRLYLMAPRLIGGCRGVTMGEKLESQGFTVAKREYLRQMCFPSEVIHAMVASPH